MRSGTEHPAGGEGLLGCPLFLFDRETVGELEPMLRDLRGGGYTPLSLRELFRCRRGLRPWPARPCALLLREVPLAEVQGLLPLLMRWETPVSLFSRAPYESASEWLQCYGEASAHVLPEGKDFHIAAFCERLDAQTLGFLREKRIWMAVTTAEDLAEPLPGGVDLLYALPVQRENRLPELLARWHRALTAEQVPQALGMRLEEPRARSVFLPLEPHPPVTGLPLAAYLSILGDTPEHLSQVIATTDWNPVFDPSDGSYRLCPAWEALSEEPLQAATAEELLGSLEEGSYLLFPSVGLLVFGYDGERDAFLGMTASLSGGYERADFRPQTLEVYCAEGKLTRLTPHRELLPVPRAEAEEAQEDLPGNGGVLHGWSASVAFANWVDRSGRVPAASLRAFLEERMLHAMRLRNLCRQENLYMEPADKYLALLEKEGSSVLRGLQGQETDAPLGSGTLLHRLLSAEGICRRACAEGLVRMQALRAFQAEKNSKKQ